MMLLRIGRRVAMLLAVVFTAASLNFLLPKLAPKNPVETKLLQLTESGGALTDIREIVRAYEEKFGLDRPLLAQYASYIRSTATLDLGCGMITNTSTGTVKTHLKRIFEKTATKRQADLVSLVLRVSAAQSALA